MDGVFECYTCEDNVREVVNHPVSTWRVPNKTAISSGTYPVVLDVSARLGPGSPPILNIPRFEGIRIHVTGVRLPSPAPCFQAVTGDLTFSRPA
jgi:hypothetical protein